MRKQTDADFNVAQYDRKLKRVLIKDWQALLPGMAPLPKGYNLFFFKIVGPLVIVFPLGMSRDSWSYGPGFYIFNLMFDCFGLASTNLNMGLITHGNANYKGHKLYNIRPRDHKLLYKAAYEEINRISYGLLQPRDFSLQQIISYFQDFINQAKKEVLERGKDPSIDHEFVTLPLLAAWAGLDTQAQQLLEWTVEASRIVDGSFEGYGGKNGWVETVTKLIANPSQLREMAQQGIIKHKLQDLPRQGFTDVMTLT